ncbi:MAG: sugar ABC transporter permease [Anaerolineae bacterium]|nr:sugar ABC transporter permease [Anaerolineae bacterium]
MSPQAKREALVGWLFASPWIIGFLLFTAGPMLFSLYASFTKYNIIRTPEWIGLKNFQQIFTSDPFFWKSLENTFWMVGFKVPIVIIVSLMLAMLLNLPLPGERIFRTIIYLPNVLSGVAAVFLWQWILAPNGLFNAGLSTIGIRGPSWFTDPGWTKPGLVVMGMWWIGGTVIIFLAGLKAIPLSLYEAAEIDGASGWKKIRHITLPMLSPTIFFQIITTIIGTFQVFSTAYIIATSSGGDVALGGPGQSLMFYVLYMYNRAFGKVGVGGFQMGYASALAWILFLIILVITLIQLKLSERWVYYEAE